MKKTVILSFSALVLLFGSCKKHETTPGLSTDQQTQVLTNYANILEAGYLDSYNAAVILQTKVNAFVANPTAQGLADAKTAWLAAREPYMQTEISRFYGGPVDGDDGDPLLNSWPLDEGYIDYLIGASHGYSTYSTGPIDTTGIINKPALYPNINATVLIQGNQPDGGAQDGTGNPVDVSVGYHAVEFLLWGQDATPASAKIPGQRPYTDYLTSGGTAPNAARRGQYLQAATDLIVSNLQELVTAWAPGQSNYRATFVANTTTGIANMFNGMGRLAKGELSSQRMGVPLLLHTQEDEHSCFSDNTHRDLWLDMQGIVNVYKGTYTRTDGSVISGLGLTDYVKAISPADDTTMLGLMTTAQAKLQIIEDNKPFDYLIDGSNSAGNQIVQNGVTAVSNVADWISQIAHDLKLNEVSVPPQNP